MVCPTLLLHPDIELPVAGRLGRSVEIQTS
jgi:hypothetical protein